MVSNMAKFDVDVQLSGNDGNAFAIFAAVTRGIRRAGGTSEDKKAYLAEAQSGDYDNVLVTSMKWVNVH